MGERPPGVSTDSQPASQESTTPLPTVRAVPPAMSARPRGGLVWSGAVVVLLVIVLIATFAARDRHSFPTLASTPDSNIANGALLAFPNPVPAGSGKGATLIAWITPNGTTGQVWVTINGAPETIFAQGSSGAQYAPWIEAGGAYEFRLYAGTTHTGPALKVITVTQQKGAG